MNLSELEFRFRYPLHACLYAVGFFAPWDRWLHLDEGRSSWLLLASEAGRLGWFSFDHTTITLLAVAILLAFMAAALRTWASAFLGTFVVQDSVMHGEIMVVDGPYRYVRNPLYLGTMLHTLALAFLMPPSGAFFSIVLIGILQFQLIQGEEGFLTRTLGAPYIRYCEKVPSIVPALKPRVSAAGTRPNWSSSFLAEIYMWGAVLSFAALGWRYNTLLILQGLLISLGVSLVTRALTPKRVSAHPAA